MVKKNNVNTSNTNLTNNTRQMSKLKKVFLIILIIANAISAMWFSGLTLIGFLPFVVGELYSYGLAWAECVVFLFATFFAGNTYFLTIYYNEKCRIKTGT